MFINKMSGKAIRWREGERLDHLFEARCDEFDGLAGLRQPEVAVRRQPMT